LIGILEKLSRQFYSRFPKKYSCRAPGNKAHAARFCMMENARLSQDAFIQTKNRRGENLMKTTLVRLLTLATLATSLSTFAAASESKRSDAANASAATQQNGCPGNTAEDKKQKRTQKTQDENQDDKDFARLLMGIYG
jgi:hypothetical protein